jgi:WD40 repeat protein
VSPEPLVASHGVTALLDAGVTGLCVLGDVAAAGLGDGRVVFLGRTGRTEVQAHDGAVLCAAMAPDGKALLTAGDDGRVMASAPGAAPRLIHDARGKWPEAIATAPTTGLVAVALGKTALVIDPSGNVATFAHDRAVLGLSFDAKGRRLACAHADGVTIWWALAPQMKPTELEWKGAHVAVAFHPDGDFLVTGMAEGALHGWRLSDGAHFRMAGYPSKPRQLSFGRKGRYLATSGAGPVLIWPFADKRNGPMGAQATPLQARDGPCLAVACAPGEDLVLAGWADGGVHLFRLSDGADVWIGGPAVTGPMTGDPFAARTRVACVAWSADTARLAWGAEDGTLGFVRLV